MAGKKRGPLGVGSEKLKDKVAEVYEEKIITASVAGSIHCLQYAFSFLSEGLKGTVSEILAFSLTIIQF